VLNGDPGTRNEIRSRLPRLFSFLIAAFFLCAATAKAQVYRNDEFGITIPVPKNTLLCPTPHDQHDHGPIFLLGTIQETGCEDSEHSRSIVHFAGYNAAEVNKKLRDFLQWECGGPCRAAPAGLRFTGLASAAGRVNRPHGWVDIIVVTQAGEPDQDFDPSAPTINYDLRLHTRARNLERDLVTFRALLQSVSLSPVSKKHVAIDKPQIYGNEEFEIALPVPERALLGPRPKSVPIVSPGFGS
jgi:hypothetical protein